jgi:putative ABC transport system permease protein
MIALNTMLLNARDRRLEIGVLKALGFQDRAVFWLVVTEGVVVCGAGGAAGAWGAKILFEEVGFDALYRFFPAFMITTETMWIAFGTSLGVGLVSGIVPGLLAARIRVIDALARFG